MRPSGVVSFAVAWVGALALALPVALGTTSPEKLVPVSALGPPEKACTTYPEQNCVLSGAFGGISLSPHILKPGGRSRRP